MFGWELKGKIFLGLQLAQSVDASVFCVKFSDVHAFPLFSLQIITSMNFFQDGDNHVMNTMTLLVKVPTSGLSNLLLLHIISMFWESVLQASLWLTNVLFIALSASDTVDDVSGGIGLIEVYLIQSVCCKSVTRKTLSIEHPTPKPNCIFLITDK